MTASTKSIWELLWDYDPNGLIVLNDRFLITIVNNAFCEMFRVERDEVIGRHVSNILDDPEDFQQVWDDDRVLTGKEKHYPRYDLFVKKVMFAIKDQGVMACIMVNITHELKQKRELLKLKEETLRNVGLVVDKHMKVAQEIAGLLGETTAETKVNLFRLAEMLKKENL